MFFRRRAAASATLPHFLGCAGHQMATAFDVVRGDAGWFMVEAAKADACVVHVIDTHVHADHYSGGPELARRVGAAYGLHESNPGRVGFEYMPTRDGQRLTDGSACGAGLSGKAALTIGFGKRFNPMLYMDEQALVDALTTEMHAPPTDMARLVDAKLRSVVPAAAHA